MHTGWFSERQRRTYNRKKQEKKFNKFDLTENFILSTIFSWQVYHEKRKEEGEEEDDERKKDRPFSVPFELQGLLYQLIRKSVRSWLKIKMGESTFSTELSFILFVYFISYFDRTNLLFNIAFDSFQFLVILLWDKIMESAHFVHSSNRVLISSMRKFGLLAGSCFQPWFISMK